MPATPTFSDSTPSEWMQFLVQANASKRWSDRQTCCLPIRLHWEDENGKQMQVEALMIELSSGGVGCIMNQPLVATGLIFAEMIEHNYGRLTIAARHTEEMLPGLFRVGFEYV